MGLSTPVNGFLKKWNEFFRKRQVIKTLKKESNIFTRQDMRMEKEIQRLNTKLKTEVHRLKKIIALHEKNAITESRRTEKQLTEYQQLKKSICGSPADGANIPDLDSALNHLKTLKQKEVDYDKMLVQKKKMLDLKKKIRNLRFEKHDKNFSLPGAENKQLYLVSEVNKQLFLVSEVN